MVGASAGGPLGRLFAREYREDVAGMVLVDATDADTVMGRMVDGKIVDYRVRLESKGRPVPPVQTLQASPPGSLTAEEQERYDRYRRNLGPAKIYRPHDRLPENLQRLDVWFRSHRNPLAFKTRDPFEAEEAQQLYEDQQRPEPPLGDMPLVVLIADIGARTVADQR